MTSSTNASNAAFSCVPVVGPDRVIAIGPVDDLGPAEEVFEPGVADPRIGLDVEEDVERRRLGQRRQAVERLVLDGRQELVEELAGPAPVQLDGGLAAEPVEGRRGQLRDRRATARCRRAAPACRSRR